MKPVKIRVRAHVHATEDENKVLQALKNILQPFQQSLPAKKERVYGLYHNPITVLTVEIKDRDQQEQLASIEENLFRRLGSSGIKTLKNTLSRRVSHNTLFLRLDKQKAFRKEFVIREEGDTVKIEIHYDKLNRKELEERLNRK